MSNLRTYYRRPIDKCCHSKEVTQDLHKHFGDARTSVFYPRQASKDSHFGGSVFEFHNCRVLSWDFLSGWCELHSIMSKRHDAIVFDDHQGTKLENILDIDPYLDLASNPDLESEFSFSASKGNTYFSARLQFNEEGQKSVILKLRAPRRPKKPDFLVIKDFWQSAKKRIRKLNSVEIVDFSTGHVGPKPVSEPLFFTSPRNKQEPHAVYIRSNGNSGEGGLVLGELFEMFKNFEGDFETQVSMSFTATSQTFAIATEAVYPVADVFRWSFSGRYVEGFSIEEVGDVFPKNGYWRFPMASLSLENEERNVQVDLIQTPNERFLEFGHKSNEALIDCFSKAGCLSDVERWVGPGHERWGLHLLCES